jgi:cytochrome b subunit of formate dehydrogenase
METDGAEVGKAIRDIRSFGAGLGLLVLLTLLVPGQAAWGIVKDCQSCHDDYLYTASFNRSVHGVNGCTSCHEVKNRDKHMEGKEKSVLISCGSCHEQIADEYKKSFHYLQEDFRCWDCHRDIHAIRKSEKNRKIAILEQCTQCHSNDDYAASGHGEAVLKGNQDAADCADCHGLHSTQAFHTSLEKYPAEAREFYTQKCKHCHADSAMMKRNNLSDKMVFYYEQTYHGKVQELGYPAPVAGCADCHTTHNILPADDPRSSINPANLEANCGRCHSGFAPRFLSYQAHPDYTDRAKYPSLYITFLLMSGLLVGTLAFFWFHTALWWRKVYWESDRMEREGIVPPSVVATGEGLQQVERFSTKYRIMHVLLVLSFFTLVLTGFPLKYAGTEWASGVTRLWGGAHVAGLFHRGAAFLLIVGMVFISVDSLRYLFPKHLGIKGWLSRLLSPDSLFPNLKDWRDIKGMFLWFFNRGEAPKFDRWTYWEKFDFFAVFWGMFAIGSSGILLWKPEWSSWIVPGWVLNIAALVHSEEALLAALFIFTVHFFNTHFIPNKFPMDRLIFTGTYRLEELKEQRPLEYERLVSEGRLESLKREHPSIPLKLISATFGLGSLLLGGFLSILILWSVLFG